MLREFQILLIETNPGDSRPIANALIEAKIPHRLTVGDARRTLDELKGLGQPDLILFNESRRTNQGLPILTEIKNDPLMGSVPMIVWSPPRYEDRGTEIHKSNPYSRVRDLIFTLQASWRQSQPEFTRANTIPELT